MAVSADGFEALAAVQGAVPPAPESEVLSSYGTIGRAGFMPCEALHGCAAVGARGARPVGARGGRPTGAGVSAAPLCPLVVVAAGSVGGPHMASKGGGGGTGGYG